MKVKLKKMSLSPKEIEDGEDEMSEDKDSGSRDEVVVLQKNSRKITTAPGNKIRKKKSFSEPFAEISPCRKGPSFQKTGGLPSSRTVRRGLRTLGRMKSFPALYHSLDPLPWLGPQRVPCFIR